MHGFHLTHFVKRFETIPAQIFFQIFLTHGAFWRSTHPMKDQKKVWPPKSHGGTACWSKWWNKKNSPSIRLIFLKSPWSQGSKNIFFKIPPNPPFISFFFLKFFSKEKFIFWHNNKKIYLMLFFSQGAICIIKFQN